ncbi:hypothetical protein SODALDRAFT_174755 [Sodiomyces alkalinus F11]|uniref:RNA polymerase II subunit A C-terminal domain phosphatase n=1 Tax=Sodiomyces alkalinus (strain CBS 110278 / VKM F-3762 / F11) TaxID=1314773 RepID=A0A3N2PU06_SODAK|nr:hypothetical protein SODALDRAFT_174755 [Sodiomyces alkalinus F11]ROT37806.1 hypothetical protein SODALDRAFT_174755 [Sodiomyces alkalinus F11]
MGKQICLGTRLRYPITITKLLKSPGDPVQRQESILEYSFKWMKEVGDHVSGSAWQEEQTTVATWDSPVEGTLKAWLLREGDPVHRDLPCLEVDEACSHEIQFHGLCAVCGKDMTEVSWASDSLDTHRATINMTHDQTGLMVSSGLATRAEHDTQRRLLRQRKLSLVVDLDQTIIHACIEPTVGEWMEDPSNPNYDAVKDVRRFQLNDDAAAPRGAVTSGCWYYVKMRPGLVDFLEAIAERYELHVYTMGTRAYALNIAKIVDPHQKLFGNRVISRDENGSILAKSLQRLFPVSTNMVVIIDDRADVWPRNRPNLIKVVPYDFFKGIGDINSSFLPKRRDLLPAPIAPAPAATSTTTTATTPTTATTAATTTTDATSSTTTPTINGNANTNSNATTPSGATAPSTTNRPSAIDDLISMSNGDDKQLQIEQTKEQERSLEHQIKDRPLLHLQEALDKESETTDSEDGEHHHHRSQVLRDDDEELFHLQQHLTEIHTEFYKLYDAKRAARRDSPPKQAPSHERHRKQSADDGVDLSMVPDVGEVLDELKSRVLQDTVIVMSGIVPLGIDVMQSEIGLQAMSFGAEIQTRVTNNVTHVVVAPSRTGTQKVRQALRIPSIKIVNQNWLTDCLSQWRHLDETPYVVHVPTSHERRRNGVAVDGRAGSQDQGNDQYQGKAETETETDANRTASGTTGEPGTLPLTEQHLFDEDDEDVEGADEDDDEDEENANDGDGDDDFAPDFSAGSPIDDLKTFDWGGIDDEMREFLGSDVDDSEDGEGEGEGDGDGDGGSSSRGTADESEGGVSDEDGSQKSGPGGTKRKAADHDGDDDDSEREGSVLAKRQRVAKDRGASKLSGVVHMPSYAGGESTSSSLPTPQVTGDEDEVAAAQKKIAGSGGNNNDAANAEDDDNDHDDDDFGADLEAELEKELEADATGG